MGRLVLDDVPASAWEAFHARREIGLAPELVDCWSRARQLGAQHDHAGSGEQLIRGEALRLHAAPLELIATVGDAILDRAIAEVSRRDFLLLLADTDGVVVRTAGGGRFAETATALRLIEGAVWSEAARGTNAIGTAATTNRSVEVHGHAHFGRPYHELVCYAAPVRGLDGAPLAVLDATSRIERADPEVGELVGRTARALEELLRLQAYAAAGVSVRRVLGRSLDRMREPAFLVEAPGTIARANGAARELVRGPAVGRDPLEVLGVAWIELASDALQSGGRALELHGRTFYLRAEPIAAPHGAILAILVVLEPVVAAAVPAPRGTSLPARTSSDPFAPIFAEDAAVLGAIGWCRQLAPTELPIMLLAETGAGKELFANAIHAASPRASGPFIAVNCGALTPALLETELFGYASGAFTGAERGGRTGLFHAATGGTLFLDEVAEMSPAMQAALLRVIETSAFRRVGDTRLERTDVRLVCATCRDLPALVAAGAFRQDLYFRLKGAALVVPPLRARTDIVAIAEHLLGETGALGRDAVEAIVRYGWPGNIRELKSVLAVARVAAGEGLVERQHLPFELQTTAETPAALDEVERTVIVRALAEARGNVSQAARQLGVARSTVYRMKRRYGLA